MKMVKLFWNRWMLRSFIDSKHLINCYLASSGIMCADSWFKMSRCSILLAWLAGVISVESGCTPELLRSDEAGSYYRLIEAKLELLSSYDTGDGMCGEVNERNWIDKKNLFKER